MSMSPEDIYKLRREKVLGEGAFGIVYLMSDPQYACKVLKDAGDEGLDPPTMREIAALRKLDHPNILQCAAVGVRHEIYMPAYETDLAKYLAKCHPWKGRARNFMHQLIGGVHAMHTAGIVHRDLKPGNILVGDDLVIGDLGATRFGIDDILPITGTDIQTLWYRAPEVLLGDRKYTSAVDMWSLGVIMCGMLDRIPNNTDYDVVNGRCPLFVGDSSIDQIYKCFQLFGTPTNATWPGVESFPEYKASFPKWEPQQLSKYFEADAVALDLLSRLLTLDPTKRITTGKALVHPYFQGLTAPAAAVKPMGPDIDPDYMSKQPDLNKRMRAILFDWLIGVCIKFRLDHMTFFLACTYIDLFLSRRIVTRGKLQLVGCTAVLMASKIVEVWAPEIQKFIDISDQAYSREQIIAMEGIMLRALSYDLYRSTEYTYMIEHSCVAERKPHLKKLYRAVLNFENRLLAWSELLEADIPAVDPKYLRLYNAVCAKIDYAA